MHAIISTNNACGSQCIEIWWLQDYYHSVTLAPRTCVEAQFFGCCFSFNCFLPAGNCSCDGRCYIRQDCCDDIRVTCQRGIIIHFMVITILLLATKTSLIILGLYLTPKSLTEPRYTLATIKNQQRADGLTLIHEVYRQLLQHPASVT